MKKSKIKSLLAVIMAGMVTLAGCSSNNSQANSNSNEPGEKVYKIGINQLMDHPALDDARKGFEDGLKELGVNAEIMYQNADTDKLNDFIFKQFDISQTEQEYIKAHIYG